MFTIGADPELFLMNPEQKLISVVGLIGGTKTEPMPIGNGCAIQEDNVAAEFCIPPCESADAFVAAIQYSLGDIDTRAQKLGLTLATLTASASFDRDQLRTSAAREFGCDPDYNAYTMRTNPRPKAQDKTLRSAGGHVHVGTSHDPSNIIKTMDLFLGVPSVLIDKDERRRQLYGKAGSFRPKPYGVEYRTLSNFWIWDKKTINWVYHQVSTCIDKCESFISSTTEEDRTQIQDCINNNDKDTAKQLVTTWGIALP
jgi:hypothetical protein